MSLPAHVDSLPMTSLAAAIALGAVESSAVMLPMPLCNMRSGAAAAYAERVTFPDAIALATSLALFARRFSAAETSDIVPERRGKGGRCAAVRKSAAMPRTIKMRCIGPHTIKN